MKTIPEKLGKYQIISVIGEGNNATVYQAFDPDTREQVALKAVEKSKLNDTNREIILQCFINEAKVGRILRHPNVVAIFDYQEDGDYCFLVMDYVDCVSLKQYLNHHKPLPENEIVNIISELLDGLDAVHGQGIVHRDIKSDNLLVRRDNNQLLISDFGIAQRKDSDLTLDRSVLGTPNNMSPEQCLGKAVDSRTDLFSAGVVLHQLLTGQNPFSGASFAETMQQILHVQPQQPSTLRAGIDSKWDQVVSLALAKHADMRFQTAAEFKSVVQSIGNSQRVLGQADSRGITRWIGIAGVLLAMAGGVYWLLIQTSDIRFSDKGVNRFKNGEDGLATSKVLTDKPEETFTPVLQKNSELKRILDQYACTEMNINQTNKGVSISGYVSNSRQHAFKEQVNRLKRPESLPVDMNLTPLLDSHCEALTMLQPFVLRNAEKRSGLNIESYQHSTVYIEGERPVFKVVAPNYAGYLYVDYFMADDKVFHLIPGSNQLNLEYLSGQTVLVGNSGETRQWQIVGPYGVEFMIAVVTDHPLFKQTRPDIEQSLNYLLDLRLALFELDDAVAVADYVAIKTVSLQDAQEQLSAQ
ncbi:MAG: protein kinase [Gammaproteobacteria bacterium]|nr:protein kinase [Gammaproteobacteria bacterium]